MVGDSMTVADLATYGRCMSFVLGKYDNIPGNIVDGFPLVKGASRCWRELCATRHHSCAAVGR